MIQVWMLVLLTVSFHAYSSEFTHIKLTPQFEQYLTQTNTKSNAKTTKLMKSQSLLTKESSPEATAMQSKMLSAILGNISNPVPVDGEESPLLEEIRNHLGQAYQGIGQSQVDNLNHLNQQFGLGMSNYAGFSWQNPYGVVQVYADRQVTPNLLGTNYLVQDTFSIEIEATALLEKLSEAELARMSASEIGAFAGITFRRIYTYYHYANSHQEGLQSDFSKLFLQFTKFNQNGMEGMGDEEIMKREDTWTAAAGGIITTPPLYNISFSGGVLAQFDFQQMASIQSHISPKASHRFEVGVSTTKTAAAGVSLELQLDFFKLLKFSLLRYDLDYEYSAGTEFKLGFTPEDWQHVKNNTEEVAELRHILKGLGTVAKLEPYTVELDESSSSSLTTRGSVLIFGKLQKSKTEQLRVIKDQMVKVFYKNYSQSVKVVQNFLSRIFSAVVYKLFKLPFGATNAAIYSRNITMEYEATHPQATNPSITRIDSTEQFSFILTQYYDAARTDRWIDRKYKNDLIWFVDNFTSLPKDYKSIIRNEQLKGPMRVESNLRVEKAGFDYLLSSPENNVFTLIVKVCDSKQLSNWLNEAKRKSMLGTIQKGADNCVKNLGKDYVAFKTDYASNYLKPSLAKFKTFLGKFYKQTENISDLQALFGPENTFINGKLSATTSIGSRFETVFSSGQFRGLGVIDTFKRSSSARMPASIISE